MTPTAATFALEFSQGLHACRGAEQVQETAERKHAETAPSVCHSHDLCDANMVIYAIFLRHGMDPGKRGRRGAARSLVGPDVEPG